MVDTECGGGKGKTKLAVAALAPSVVMFAAGCFSSAALTIRVAINSDFIRVVGFLQSYSDGFIEVPVYIRIFF